MAVTDIRQTVLEIVNVVERKLGYTPSSALTQTRFTTTLLDYLNEVVADMNAAGDWAELRTDVTVTAAVSVVAYSVNHTSIIDHIYEVAVSGRIAPLTHVNVSEIKQLGRLSSTGTPNQFALTGVDASANPIITVWPMPNSAQNGNLMTVSVIEKVPLYSTGDGATVPPFPATVLIQGLHAKALLEESGGEPTRQWEARQKDYERGKQAAINAFTTDTGWDVRFRPRRSR